MKFSISFIALVSTVLFAAVHAAPAPLCNGELCSRVAAREVIDVAFDDLAVRAKKSSGSQKANTSKGILSVQKKQGQKQRTQQRKTAANVKVVKKKSGAIDKKVEAFRTAEKAKGKLGLAQLNAKKDSKTAKAAQWASKKNTADQKTAKKAAQTSRRVDRKANGLPSPGNQVSTKTKVSKQEKNNVRQQFRAANSKLRQTEGVPGRKDTVTVGPHKTDGRAVRQAAFNSYLHSKTPVGRNPINKQPKNFNNRPYAADHGDTGLAGKKALPQNGKEYPIIDNSPNGWTGQGAVGALRAVTYKQGGKRKLSVVGHDTSRGGDANDHYTATVTPATRELDLDFEDFE